MSAISNAYLIIFLPLISSLFCCLFSRKKFVFTVLVLTNLLMLLFSWQNLINVLAYKKLSNNFELGFFSLGLEFLSSAFGATLLFLVILVKLLIFLFFFKDLDNFLDEKENKSFYPLYLFQLFALAGIFTADSSFNLITFVEIYIFTIFVGIKIFLNQSQNIWKVFIVNSLTTILILFCLIIILLIFSENNISKIANEISLVSESNKLFLIVIFITLIFSLLAKFSFPYFCFKSEKNKVSYFVLGELFFVKSVVALFVFLKFLYIFFGKFAIIAIQNIAPFLITTSLVLVSYFALKLSQEKSLKQIFCNILMNNIALVFLAIALSNISSLQSLFFLIINFLLVYLAFFLIFSLSEEKIDKLGKVSLTLGEGVNNIIFLPIKILIFFLAAFPISFLFFSNFYLIKAALNSIYCPVILIITAIANFTYIALSLRLFDMFEINSNEEKSTKNWFYTLTFLLLFLVTIFFFLSSTFLNDLSLEFSASLLNF